MKLPEEVPKGLYTFSLRKRWFDVIMGSTLAGLAAVPEVIGAALLKRSLDTGSVYIRQERLGTEITKLRTMLNVPPNDMITSVRQSSNVNDPRVPPGFPKFARQTRFDEVPQLRQAVYHAAFHWGNTPRISLGGIRPLITRHADEFHDEVAPRDPELARKWRDVWLPIAPRALFSPASVAFMRRESNENMDPAEWMKLEVDYCENSTMETDFSLIGQTIGNVAMATIEEAADRFRSLFSPPRE
jgi:lipopolysaccharide/colanic/teichoic acid biosynthesis glycosyltransferase